jgi:type I restriction enzyme M protein
MCKMNMVLHGVIDFKIEYGDVLGNPKLVDGGRLKTYDKVVAKFPFSMDWDNKIAVKGPYNRFRFGIPPEKDKADFAFIQHMFASLLLLLVSIEMDRPPSSVLRVFCLEEMKRKRFVKV